MTLYEGPTRPVLDRIIADSKSMSARGRRVGIIAANEDDLGPHPSVRVVRFGAANDHGALAANLYNALRTLDAEGVDVILVRAFPDESGLAAAVHDRLRRAAGRIITVSQ
jgi:hypothetical protein